LSQAHMRDLLPRMADIRTSMIYSLGPKLNKLKPNIVQARFSQSRKHAPSIISTDDKVDEKK